MSSSREPPGDPFDNKSIPSNDSHSTLSSLKSKKQKLTELFRSRSMRESSTGSSSTVVTAPSVLERSSETGSLSRRKSFMGVVNKLSHRLSTRIKGSPLLAEGGPSSKHSSLMSQIYDRQLSSDGEGEGGDEEEKDKASFRSLDEVQPPRMSFRRGKRMECYQAADFEDDRALEENDLDTIPKILKAENVLPAPKSVWNVISTKCTLLDDGTPYQGTLHIMSRFLRFCESISTPAFQMTIGYDDIVAIIPKHPDGVPSIHVATQTRLVCFSNVQQRDEIFEKLRQSWLCHIKSRLAPPNSRRAMEAQEASRRESAAFPEDGKATNETSAMLTLRDEFPCRCPHHYPFTIVELSIPSTPSGIANSLFGGFGRRPDGFMDTFMKATGATFLEESPWSEGADGKLEREVIVNVPDAFKRNSTMRVQLEQRLWKEEGDVIVMEVRQRLRSSSVGNHYQCRLRWCLVRRHPEEGDDQDDFDAFLSHTKVLITGKVISTSHNPPIPVESIQEMWIEYLQMTMGTLLTAASAKFSVDRAALLQRLQDQDAKQSQVYSKIRQFFHEVIFYILLPKLDLIKGKDVIEAIKNDAWFMLGVATVSLILSELYFNNFGIFYYY